MTNYNNIERAIIDEDLLQVLVTLLETYNLAKDYKTIYRKDLDLSIAKSIITLYNKCIQPNYSDMIYNFKRRYIANEVLVEKNDTPEERKGLSLVYDYIQAFDINNEYFNIFTTSLQLHSILYKISDDRNALQREETRKRANQLYEEGRREKDIKKIREAQKLLKSLEHTTFGGHLRTGNAGMMGFMVSVPDPEEATEEFNKYLAPEKQAEYEYALNNYSILDYIDYAVSTTCQLIGLQPFENGNKRTFRALLNVMFKKKNLPPVYITGGERKVYHEALERCLISGDYSEMCGFYYYKICDSIYELDYLPYLKSQKKGNGKKVKTIVKE